MEKESHTEHIHCTCGDNCLNEKCPFFMRGQYCNSDCKCPNCRNKPEFENERLEAFTAILNQNPLIFTPEDQLTQDEFTAISNFAMLIKSVDTDPFKLKEQEKLKSTIISRVLELSIATIISAANQALTNTKDPTKFEEEVENAVALEFKYITESIKDRITQ